MNIFYQIKNKSAGYKMAVKYAQVIGSEPEKLKAWSSAPGFKIGSFDVYPLSLQSMGDLTLAGNAFFAGKQILHGDIAAYIWRHMPEYDTADPNLEKNCRRFFRTISKESNPQGLVDNIQLHLEAAFADAIEPEPIATIVSEFAAIYGLNPVDAAYTDLRIVFQTIRATRARNFRTTNN